MKLLRTLRPPRRPVPYDHCPECGATRVLETYQITDPTTGASTTRYAVCTNEFCSVPEVKLG